MTNIFLREILGGFFLPKRVPLFSTFWKLANIIIWGIWTQGQRSGFIWRYVPKRLLGSWLAHSLILFVLFFFGRCLQVQLAILVTLSYQKEIAIHFLCFLWFSLFLVSISVTTYFYIKSMPWLLTVFLDMIYNMCKR